MVGAAVAAHLNRLPDDVARQEAETILRGIPPELRSAREPGFRRRAGWPIPWPCAALARRRCATLLALPAGTPSLRLLADETAKVLAGMSHVLDGLALLVDAPGRASCRPSRLPAKRARLAARCSSMRRARSSRSARSSFSGSPPPGRTAPQRWCSPRSWFCCCRREAIWPTAALSRSRSAPPAASLRGDHQIRGAAGPRDLPGLLRRHRSFLHTGRLCRGPEPAAGADGRVHRHGLQLHAAPRAHEPDELRHGAILQFRAGDRCRVRRRSRWHFACCRRCRRHCGRAACSPSLCAICAASRSPAC